MSMYQENDVDLWFVPTLQVFEQRIHADCLHHGILLNGAAGIGKFKFATAIAKTLLCHTPNKGKACSACKACLLYAAGSHPDLHVIESEKQIGIDAIRQLSNTLNKTAQIGHNKVCIIRHADTMTEAASNALLKTLEEPTPNTYLLLITESQHAMLPTLLSRTEKVLLHSPTKAETLEWLRSQELADVPELLLSLFASSPYLIKKLLSDPSLPDMSQLKQDLLLVDSMPTLGLSLAKKWDQHATILLQVCAEFAHKKFVSSLDSRDYIPYKRCLECSGKLAQPGINKVALLQSVLQLIPQSLKE